MTDSKQPKPPPKDEFNDDGPEMTEAEMLALFGESPGPPPVIDIPKPLSAEMLGLGTAAGVKPAAGAKDTGATDAGAAGAGSAATPRARESKGDVKAAKAAGAAAAKDARAAANAAKASEKAANATEKAAKAAAKAAEKAAAKEARAAARSAMAPEGPRSRTRGPVTLVLLVAAAWLSFGRVAVPRPVPANAPETEFSSARAMAHLVEIARAAHPPGSPEHVRVREYIVDWMRDLGLDPEVQTTTSVLEGGSLTRTATVRNIVARLPGTSSTGAVLLTAHYDGRELSHGAGDDGAGVVAILEAVRALRAGPALQNDLIILITDAEELGLLGARAFVERHPWMSDVRLALSFEMRGGGGPSIMFETGESNGWVVRALQASDPAPLANSLSYEVYRRLPNKTDFTPFKEAGVQGLNFAAIDRAAVYHQAYDSPENLNEGTIQHHGLRALAVTRYLANEDLEQVDAPNVTYFRVPFWGLVVYDASLVVPLAGVMMVVVVLAFFAAVRAGVGGIATGVGLSIVGAGLAFSAGVGLLRWLPVFHPEMGSLHGSAFHSEGWYVLALAAAAFAIVTLLNGLARRWLSSPGLAFGGLVIPLGAAAYLSVKMPLAAANLQWPAMAAALAVLIVSIAGSTWKGRLGWMGALLFALPVLLVLPFVIETLWIAMTFRLAGVLGATIALTLFLVLPALDALRHPNSWWAPVTGALVAAVALGVGLLMARPSASRPAPSTLVYAYERGSQSAVWATDALVDSADAAARAWAVARAGGGFDATEDLSRFAYLRGETPVAPAPPAAIPPPSVSILSDTTVGTVRRVTAGFRSEIGAERMVFRQPDGGRTGIVSVNGRALASGGAAGIVDHWGAPDWRIVLALEMPSGAPVELDIVEHTLRPQEFLGADVFKRPPELAPDITKLSDRAMILTAFANLQTVVDPVPDGFSMGGATASAAGAGTLGEAGGSTDAVIDTTGGGDGSTGALGDTIGMVGDTIGMVGDTIGMVGDTIGAGGDSLSVVGDTIGAGGR